MTGRKVLLVNSNRMQPPIAPIALDYIGAALKPDGHEVRLLDLCLEPDGERAAAALSSAWTPDLVAVTFRNTDDCYFASRVTFVDSLRDVVALLRRHVRAPVVVGGFGFSLMPAALLAYSGADYGVCGEGETALPRLLQVLAGEGEPADVPGLVHRGQDGVRMNPPARAEVAAMPLAARDVVDNGAYFRLGGQVGIETKRGCPKRCVYCAERVIKGARSRLRAPADIVTEVRSLLAQGADCYHLCDSEFNLPASHAEAVCDALAEAGLGDKVRWYTYAAPRPFPARLAGAMRRAGCVGINFGADSGCDRMLRALGRDHDARCLEETARRCRDAGITLMYDLLLGGPGETPDSVRETLELMRRIAPDRVGISLGVRLYPGTPLAHRLARRDRAREGIVGDPDGLAPYFYISPALGEDPAGLVRDLVGRDPRFFLPGGGTEQDYNYNDNTVLTNAIARGYRGAYWDILRKLHEDIPP